MNSNRVLNWIAVPTVCAALAAAGGATAQEAPDGREISIVVEEGDRVPAQVLDTLAAQELGSGTTANMTFSILEGKARLAGADGQTVAAGGGAVAHAEIIAGPHYDETYVRMFADGKPVGKPIRVGTIASGGLDKLLSKDVPTGSEALLLRAADHAAVDTGLLRSQAAVDNSEKPSGQYCATIVDKERDIYGFSRVLAEGCSERSEAEALAQAQSMALASGGSVQASWLMTFFEHANLQGIRKSVYGCCGDCDSNGYKIGVRGIPGPTPGWWVNHLSSIAGNGTYCNTVRYNIYDTWDGYGAPRSLDDWYVGDYYNDRIQRVHVYAYH